MSSQDRGRCENIPYTCRVFGGTVLSKVQLSDCIALGKRDVCVMQMVIGVRTR